MSVTELLKEMAREGGHTVVVVTHDPRILHIADRIVSIEDGRIVPRASQDTSSIHNPFSPTSTP